MELTNKRAYHDYFIEDSFVAGLQLTGTEVKSLREGKAGFTDSFCVFHGGELFVRSLHIAEYSMGTIHNHIPLRERKLLMRKPELAKLEARIREKGYTIIPLRIFFTEKGFAKMEIGLGKGKKHYDKRETIKTRENERMIKRTYGK